MNGGIKKPNANVKKVLQRLQHPGLNQLASDFVDEYDVLNSPEAQQRGLEAAGSIKTVEDAKQFLIDHMHMIEAPSGRNKGKLIHAPMSLAREIALGRALTPIKKSQANRGRQYHDIVASRGGLDGGLSHLSGVLGGTAGPLTFEGIADFHSHTLGNPEASTQLAREVRGLLAPKIAKGLDGMGGPDGATGVFSPDENWSMEYDGENGYSDWDLKQTLDDEDAEEWKASQQGDKVGPERGTMIMQKLLAHRFADESTGAFLSGGFPQITADHIPGRLNADHNGAMDNPFHLALMGANNNQIKSGKSDQYGDDSFNKFAQGGMEGKPMFRQLAELGEEGEFISWVAERILSANFDDRTKSHLDQDASGEVEPTEALEFAVDVAEIAGMDTSTIKQYMLASGENPDLHMDLANLSKYVPRKADRGPQNISPNTWRGAAGIGYDGTEFLDGFRKSMLIRMANDPELQSQILDIRSRMEQQGKSEQKIAEAIRVARKEWASVNLKGPMQGHSAQYGLGRLDNKEFINWFKEQGLANLESIRESHPEIYEQLVSELGNLDGWESTLQTYVGGDRPYHWDTDHPEYLRHLQEDPFLQLVGTKQIMKSKAGRGTLSPAEVSAFFDAYDRHAASTNVPKKDRLRDDEGNPIGPFSEGLKLL
jgi:hypothetical protein